MPNLVSSLSSSYLGSGRVRGCPDCGPFTPDQETEPFVGRGACDACGSRLQGDRHPAHAFDDDEGDVIHIDLCSECLMAAEAL